MTDRFMLEANPKKSDDQMHTAIVNEMLYILYPILPINTSTYTD